MKEMTHEWLVSAESDLLIIDKILGINTLTHQIAFHAQQAIEKSFKAIIEEFKLDFVKTHALETLYNIVKDKINIYLDIDYLMMLDQMYIDARYPGELGLLPDGKPTLKEARAFYDFASLIYQESKNIVR
jgi:HEPN domain-containing protein